MVNNLEEQLRNSKEVLQFRETAIKYCVFIESFDQYDVNKFLAESYTLLSELNWRACSLPDFEATTDGIPESEVSHEEWETIFKSLKNLLSDRDYYYEIYDPISPEENATPGGSISDDLADIYCDLKEGIIYWDSDSKTRYEDAVWHWKCNFESHWGTHLTSALRTIHWLLYNYIKFE